MNLHTYFDLSDKKNDKKVFLTEKTNLLKSGKIPNFIAKKTWWAVMDSNQ